MTAGTGPSWSALPYYESLANPLSVPRAAGRFGARFWRALGDVDAVWLLGPHPLAIAFALLAALRGRRVILGVRQDLPAYVRNRHPGRRMMIAAALAPRGSVSPPGPALERGRGRPGARPPLPGGARPARDHGLAGRRERRGRARGGDRSFLRRRAAADQRSAGSTPRRTRC